MDPALSRDSKDLRSDTLLATRWQILARASRLVSQLAISILLARLLSPADFGVMALCMLVTSVAAAAGNLGLGAAVVNRQELTNRHLQLGLAVSLISGVVAAIAIFALSPSLTRMMGIPGAAEPLRSLAPLLLINAWGGMARAVLIRRLDFRRLFFVDFSGFFLGYGVTGVACALKGLGVWSLILSTLVQSVTSTLVCIQLVRPPLIPRIGRREMRELISFGLGISLNRTLNLVVTQVDRLVVSSALGPMALGLYARANQILQLPGDFFATSLGSVIFPTFSRIKDDRARLSRAYRQTTVTSSLLLLPLSVTLLILCPEIISVLFGEQWTKAILPAQILVLASAFRSQDRITSSLLKAMGALRVLFLADTILLLLVCILSWPAANRYGLEGVAVVVSLATTLAFALKLTNARRRLDPIQLWQSHWPILRAAILTGLSVGLTKALLGVVTDSQVILLVGGGVSSVFSTVAFLRDPRLISPKNHQLWYSLIAELGLPRFVASWLSGKPEPLLSNTT